MAEIRLCTTYLDHPREPRQFLVSPAHWRTGAPLLLTRSHTDTLHHGSLVTSRLLFALLFLSLGAVPAVLAAPLKPEEVPAFRIQGRVIPEGGQAPAPKRFTFRLDGEPVAATSNGADWSDWISFGPTQAAAVLKGYPNLYLQGYPVVLHLRVEGAAFPVVVEAHARLEETGETVTLRGELFGPSLGILNWRDANHNPHLATMAAYNQKYWQAAGLSTTPAARPHKFPIVDRFIGGDDDRLDWEQGIGQLANAGMTAIMLPPSAPLRDTLKNAGLQKTAWAVYNPPGYAFDYDPKITPASIQQWAEEQAAPYRKAGYAPEDMALFAMSDEPGWYYPSMFGELQKSQAGMARFRQYLQAQHLRPSDVGVTSWNQVQPIGESAAVDLPRRRLFYWTVRFFARDSEEHFAHCTHALETAFYPGLPVFTNWNFFSGRFYVPGPVANNPDKASPDAAMGGHDWLEFGRLRGSTRLWTEDWFPDSQAYQWSYYAARLRSAARSSGVEFGGYVVPRASGDRADGMLQKMLCLVGSGAKSLEFFVFGPEYNFPGNCYSEKTEELGRIAQANRMIASAEDLLWPGRPPISPVAILMPRSAQPWDRFPRDANGRILAPVGGVHLPAHIEDATNTNLNGNTVDYMAEVADLYLALQHANIPVEILDEDDLTSGGLKSTRVVYVTEPEVPAEGQWALADWMRGGGTLVRVSGAAAHDRYGEPCAVLDNAAGIREKPRPRLMIPNLDGLTIAAAGTGAAGDFRAVGVRGVLDKGKGKVLASFADAAPAIVERGVGRGREIYFGWLPGISYARSAAGKQDGLPTGFSSSIRQWITYPVMAAGIAHPATADQPLVETPMLLSNAGAAVTLLNWSGAPLPNLNLTIRIPFAAHQVTTVLHGPVAFHPIPGGLTCSLPLGSADILLIR